MHANQQDTPNYLGLQRLSKREIVNFNHFLNVEQVLKRDAFSGPVRYFFYS